MWTGVTDFGRDVRVSKRCAKWINGIGLGYTHVVDADLESYFDSIPHAKLVERVGSRVSDARVLKLIEAFLQQARLRYKTP